MPRINNQAVYRLFAANGLKRSQRGFSYQFPGFAMEFEAPWLSPAVDAEYDLDEVRKMMTNMVESVKSEAAIQKDLRDGDKVRFVHDTLIANGMVTSGDGTYYKVVDGKALFGVDLDYVFSMIHTGKYKLDSIAEMLNDMKETAEYEAKVKSLVKGNPLLAAGRVKEDEPKRKKADSKGKRGSSAGKGSKGKSSAGKPGSHKRNSR